MIKSKSAIFLFFSCIILISGCATYYMKTIEFQDLLYAGKFNEADNWLEHYKKGKRNKNKVLHLLNRGYVARMLGDYNRSISYLTEADILIEDYRKNIGAEALTLVTNPTVKPYKTEDFETVLVNYFQANNYLSIGKTDDALVECRKINNKLNILNDKYPKHKNRYKSDAFAHLVMGLIYDSKRNYNDAFIAYRNAYETYKKDYEVNYNVLTPQQLKKDILRSAAKTGLWNEVEYYEKEFGLKYEPLEVPYAELVFFWENGFGPVKSEWSINVSSNVENGMLVIDNAEAGIHDIIPIPFGAMGWDKLGVMRIAFPKYDERRPIFTKAKVISGSKSYNLEIAENINEIAFKCLHDRMWREVANSVSRLATKKALEYAVGSKNDLAGVLVGIAGASTEKVDTRNWQTLPYSISYSRIPLHEGNNKLIFQANSSNIIKEDSLQCNPRKGEMIFQTYHLTDSYVPQ